MGPLGLSKKEIKKSNKELIEIHKSLLHKHLNEIPNISLKHKNKINTLYDMIISESNIRHYYNHHIKIFFHAMLTGRLNQIQNYTYGH